MLDAPALHGAGSLYHKYAHSLAGGILETCNEVDFEYVLVVQKVAVEDIGMQKLPVLNHSHILQLSEPHDLCLCFSNHVIGDVGSQLEAHYFKTHCE